MDTTYISKHWFQNTWLQSWSLFYWVDSFIFNSYPRWSLPIIVEKKVIFNQIKRVQTNLETKLLKIMQCVKAKIILCRPTGKLHSETSVSKIVLPWFNLVDYPKLLINRCQIHWCIVDAHNQFINKNCTHMKLAMLYRFNSF